MKNTKYEQSPLMGLTEDLLLEILHRMPAKSLGKLKCVSKKLDSLISSPKFAISHLDFSYSNSYPPLTIAMLRYNTLSSLTFKSYTDITEGVKLKPWSRQFDNDDTFEGCYFFLIGSCNGLLCIYIKEMDKKRYTDDFMYLWNPVTKESREISLPVGGISTYVHVDSCWFGFVNSLDDYKILLVSTMYKPYHEKYMYLYSLRNDRWRRIAVSGDNLFSISLCNSIFMYDALHYLVRRECILKFNLVTETFERIPLSIVPELFPSVDEMVLGVIDAYDCLCVTFVHHSKRRYELDAEGHSEESSEEDEEEGSEEEESEEDEWMLEVWTLEEYNKWYSWKKWYRIELEEEIAGLCTQFLGFTYTGKIVYRAVDDGLVVFDPSLNPPPYVFVRNSCSKVHNMNTYVESLVSPFSPFPLEEEEDEEEEEEEEEEEDKEEEDEDGGDSDCGGE